MTSKNIVFRTLLAILHFNDNTERKQQRSKDGKLYFGVSYPKWKKGGHTVRKIMENPSFGKKINFFI
jgi:hypothetical protein